MTDPCTKASKIDSMDKKLNSMDERLDEINTVIHKTANGDSLLAMAVNTNKTVKSMNSDVRALLTFQTVVETRREMNEEVQEKKLKKQRIRITIISLVVGSGLTILGMVIAMILK